MEKHHEGELDDIQRSPCTVVCSQVRVKSMRVLLQIVVHRTKKAPSITGVQGDVKNVAKDSPCDCGGQIQDP